VILKIEDLGFPMFNDKSKLIQKKRNYIIATKIGERAELCPTLILMLKREKT